MFHLLLACLFSSSPEAFRSVNLLSHHHFTVRQKAQENLQHLGWRALPALMSGLEHKDPSVRSLCQQCVSQLVPPKSGLDLPPLGDVQDFSVFYGECEQQVTRCRLWVKHLTHQRYLYGYSDGCYDAWIKQTNFHAQVWGLLRNAYSGDDDESIWRRKQLACLREVMGRERYNARWLPPKLPELKDPAPVLMPRAGPNNAAGGP